MLIKRKVNFFLTLTLLSFFPLVNCNLLVSNEQLCASDLKNYDECYTLLLISSPACGQGVGTCTIGYIELAKTICAGRMKLQSCRAHRD
ncbi:hypothetical protein LEP1GSC050_3342 [Leptospira broomii serovar Hurstbridge str. 5399]|uniref:Uncharacterized protein n=1 Tax=Leptospira broomii serovar Hurstbridge str. 5399 TaxID=1049789 RepID=T0GLC2_9LEPT|nr:hypothetical protein [Leptospira broomii]EQA46158.1 hypothetical protein LEP1GSC050_3342 [Leptospira broomii serovar Hurstbridge str. 5399]